MWQMLQVRQLLTEVLLDVTNREIADVAHTVYVSSKMKQDRGSVVYIATTVMLTTEWQQFVVCMWYSLSVLNDTEVSKVLPVKLNTIARW